MSAASGYAAYYLQSQANKNVKACSYLDPISIDIVALAAGLFLIVEGLTDIVKHKHSPVRSQVSRFLRVCFGVSIVVIHIMQFIRK